MNIGRTRSQANGRIMENLEFKLILYSFIGYEILIRAAA